MIASTKGNIVIPGPDIIIACPSCGTLTRKPSLMSGNTFGAIYWTDGKMEAPMLPILPAIVGCPSCGRTYWFEDAEEVGEIKFFTDNTSVPAEWRAASKPITLDEEKLLDAIDEGMATTTEKEEYLRLMAWHAFNDRFRGDEHHGKDPQPSERQARNMQEIVDLFCDSDNWDYLLISAEAARQLGDFQQAMNIINHINLEEVQRRIDLLTKLCSQESRIVHRMSESNEESA